MTNRMEFLLRDFQPYEDKELLTLINSYLQEFPNDEDFIDICNAQFGIDFDELKQMLINRKTGQKIRSEVVAIDLEKLIYI